VEAVIVVDSDGVAKRVQVHPSTTAILRWFEYDHLTDPELRQTSRKFHRLAHDLADGPGSAELTVALRKLLESKDAAVRAVLS
jgi:hypothetical protein